jgi:flavin-dependent thymidylate synthase
MMQTSLIYFTGKDTKDETWYAARLLAFSKNTRLQMTPDGFENFMHMSEKDLKNEVEYMSSTIASSWELVDLIFSINSVSRACAQQITRTRTASYAMQSQRVTNMKDVTFHVPASVPSLMREYYRESMQRALNDYIALVENDISLEDARGVLPINAHCNLIAKYNLRAWVDLVRARDSLRVQGEYQDVIKGMKAEVLRVWPWAQTFIEPKAAKAVAILEEVAVTLPHEQKIKLAKAADLIKKESS